MSLGPRNGHVWQCHAAADRVAAPSESDAKVAPRVTPGRQDRCR
ncbi:MAG: hypothetical protein OXG81_11820 [Acidobacteria bacterium]|nr:hypothetical protein [Acidobacteriota bacterium]